MAAAMAHAVAGQRAGFGDARFLAEAGKRVVFAENGDDRTFLARFAHHRRRDAGEVGGDPEAFLFEHFGVLGAGLIFVIGDFRHVPDAVAQRDVFLALGIHQAPDLFLVLHVSVSDHDVGEWRRRESTGAAAADMRSPSCATSGTSMMVQAQGTPIAAAALWPAS